MRQSLLSCLPVAISSAPLPQHAVAACASARQKRRANVDDALAALERRHGGRLGVAALDLGTGRRARHRENVSRGAITIEELCKAAIVVSDNTAANLLVRALGGVDAVNRFIRSLGDPITRLDRLEPALNEARPGDPRDTTTPAAMLEILRRLFLGDGLSASSRDRLVGWHRATETGKARLRAGLPHGWTIAHKTGTGERGATNDVGVAWRPGGAPVILSVYYAEGAEELAAREAVLASVAQLVTSAGT